MIDDIKKKLTTAGFGAHAKNLWQFDMECIEDNGDYVALTKKFAKLCGGALDFKQLTDSVDIDEEEAQLKFSLDGKKYKWDLEVEDDWVDPAFLLKMAELLESKKVGLRFTYLDLGGQDFVIGCASGTELKKLNSATGLNFEWLSDAVRSWDEDEEDDEEDDDEDEEEEDEDVPVAAPQCNAFDAATGRLQIDNPSFPLTPKTTRATFLQSPLFPKSEVLVKNDPWCSFKVKTPVQIAQHQWHMALFFNGERLWRIQLHGSRCNPKQLFTAKEKHKWGTVSFDHSEYDSDKFTTIWIDYK